MHCIHKYMHMYMHTYIRTYTCSLCTYIHMYIYIHTYIPPICIVLIEQGEFCKCVITVMADHTVR